MSEYHNSVDTDNRIGEAADSRPAEATDVQPGEANDIRPGEVAVALPSHTDAGVYFIGVIRTPWKSRAECPKRGVPDGPVCSIEVDPRWSLALTDLAGHRRVQVLYWMHRARRDLVLQTPFRTGTTTGTFALRSPVRPNPIASSLVDLVAIDGTTLKVRGLDCIDGTPLIDLKPDHGSVTVQNEADAPTSK
jgi:tRNA-Thr(GGU) m(6)t(6)A37 methyltransferase TsaA